jgi:hypothetical protein
MHAWRFFQDPGRSRPGRLTRRRIASDAIIVLRLLALKA